MSEIDDVRERALRGPLTSFITSPLRRVSDDRDEILHPLPYFEPAREVTVAVRGQNVLVSLDPGAMDQVVLATYSLLGGWTALDELADGLRAIAESRHRVDQGRAVAAGVLLSRLNECAGRLSIRVRDALLAVDRRVREAALDVLGQTKEHAQPSRAGLVAKNGGWLFDGGPAAVKALALVRSLVAAWKPVADLRSRLAEPWARSPNAQLDLLPPSGPIFESWEASAELKAAYKTFQIVLDDAVRQLWILDRWWQLLDTPFSAGGVHHGDDEAAQESAIAASLGETCTKVLEANASIAKVLDSQRGRPAWAESTRPDIALAETIQSEPSAWRYRLLVEAVSGALGFYFPTFEWQAVQAVYDRVDFLVRNQKEIDAALGDTSVGVGLLSAIPPLRPVLAPVCLSLVWIRTYRGWVRHSVDEPIWLAVVDPDFSSRAPAPDITALLLEAGLSLVDLVGPAAGALLRAARRYGPAALLVAKLASSPGGALHLAKSNVQTAAIEMSEAATAFAKADLGRQAGTAAREIELAAQTVSTARPARTPALHLAKPSIPSGLPTRLTTAIDSLARTASRQEPIRATETPPPAFPSPTRPTPLHPEWAAAAVLTQSRRRWSPAQLRRALGVPVPAALLEAPFRGVEWDGRPYRRLTVRLGDGVKRVEGRGPDPYSLLSAETLKDLDALRQKLGYKPRFKLFHWLHLCGPGWGIDVRPWLFGAYPFNLSAQARIENLSRRLADAYLRRGDSLIIRATEYSHLPNSFPNSEHFVDQVVYTVFRNSPTRDKLIIGVYIKATDPRLFARTGEAVLDVGFELGPLAEDAAGAAPGFASAFSRSAKPALK